MSSIPAPTIGLHRSLFLSGLGILARGQRLWEMLVMLKNCEPSSLMTLLQPPARLTLVDYAGLKPTGNADISRRSED